MDKRELYYIITGASRGIGKEVAYSMAAEGYNLILVARNEELLQQVSSDIKIKYNVNVEYVVCDLSCLSSIEKMFDKCKELSKDNFIHGIVYCSGQTSITPLKVLDYEVLQSIYSVNVLGFIELCRCYSLQNFKNKSNCNIVTISSVAAIEQEKGKLAYASSKAALNTAVRIISKELVRYNIRVNAISPAFVATDMSNETLSLRSTVKQDDMSQPLGMIEPKNIADYILFLISNKANKITGANFEINGGKIV